MALVDTHIALGSGIVGIALAGLGVDPLVAIPVMAWAGYSSGAADIEPVNFEKAFYYIGQGQFSLLSECYDHARYWIFHYEPRLRLLNPFFALHVLVIDPIFHKHEDNWGKRYWWLDLILRAFGYGATYISLVKILGG